MRCRSTSYQTLWPPAMVFSRTDYPWP